MHRIFGRPAAPAPAPPPAPSLEDHMAKLSSREPELNKKIQECDAQLLSIKAQLAKCRTAGQQAPLKSRALVILRRRQQYIQQRDQLATRAFNLEQTTWAIESMREAKDHMTVMRSAADEMRTTFKDLDVGEMEDIHEDIVDIMADTNEINELMSRGYESGYDTLSEKDLDAALAGLDDELAVLDVGATGEAVAAPAPAAGYAAATAAGAGGVALPAGGGGGASATAAPSYAASAADYATSYPAVPMGVIASGTAASGVRVPTALGVGTGGGAAGSGGFGGK